MDSVISIIIAILIFGFIVVIHELGHFIFAKRNGIFVEEFAIGMGPKIISTKKGETVYSIRALPFGGFCKMYGEDEEIKDERAFSSKSAWIRFKVIFGGPLFNFILAFIFAIVLILISGAVTTTVINEVIDDSPAQEAGILPGDKIVEINDKNIIAYKEIIYYINENKGGTIDLTYKRDGEKHSVQIVPELSEDNIYRIGITPVIISKANILQVIKYSFIEILFWIKMVFYSLGLMFTGSVSANEVAGPIGLVNVVSEGYKESVKFGLLSVINTISFFIVFISSNLGVMNLLPIPALDGGRLVFIFIEAVRGKPIDQNKEGFVHFIGYVLLMLLMVVILFNDVRKLFI